MHPFAHMTVEISALQEAQSNCKGRFSMRLLYPFGRARAFAEARSLHDRVVAVARSEALYGPDRAPDTLQGRLELLTVHAALCFLRLRAEPDARALAQSFADILFRALDAGLREAGVGDLTVPKTGFRLGSEQPDADAPPPALGQHTDEILARAGYSEAEIAHFKREGIV